jgi:putative hydrolase of the HAD superfamily
MKRYQAVLFDVYGTLLISGAGDTGTNPVSGNQLVRLSSMMHRYAVAGDPQALSAALNAAVRSDHRLRQGEGEDYPEIDINALPCRMN